MRLVASFADTNTGRKRRHNEDAFVSEPPLFAVADGMGGAQAGEVASAIAANTLLEDARGSGAGGAAHVVELIQTANLRVYERAHEDATASGMGTTMTVARVEEGGMVVIGHVGDSRAYVLRDGTLEQLTDDHSLVAELVRRGELSPEEAEVHPQRSVITRALGTDPSVDVDAFSFQARPGDIFLLCSDGLTSMVDVDTVAGILDRNRDNLAAAARALIKAANDRGGEDNITTVLFAVGGDDERDRTVEAAAVVPELDEDEQDTLHPEDNVAPPAAAAVTAAAPPESQTMVLSPEEIRAALLGEAAAAAAGEAPPPGRPPTRLPEPQPPEPTVVPLPPPAAVEPLAVEPPAVEPPTDEPARASVPRRLLALVVIVVLVALIVVLMTKGLTR